MEATPLRVENLRAEVGGVEVLRGVSFEARPGEPLGLLGPNGAGKTTTIRSILGLTRITGGKLLLGDDDVTGHAPEENPRLGIAWSPEDRRLIPFLTVEENLVLALRSWGVRGGEVRERIRWVADLVPQLKVLLPRKAGGLSGGQQKLVAVARAIAVRPRVLLLDEPMEGLSVKNAAIVAGIVSSFVREWKPVVIVAESNREHLALVCRRAVRIERGATIGEVELK